MCDDAGELGEFANALEAKLVELAEQARAAPHAKQVRDVLEDIAGIALNIRRLANAALQDDTGASIVAIEALAEKAGYLADAAFTRMGGTGAVCGEYAEWIDRPSIAGESIAAARTGAA